jgi:hypothetical protein
MLIADLGQGDAECLLEMVDEIYYELVEDYPTLNELRRKAELAAWFGDQG